ncbi:MAG TPA: hypothetical protein VJ874_01245, partial [Candidatus Thermoplasmatota archaeon]|nr:hypothetical protein [Candidatus Thermoplasmatota archaeon]
MDLLDDDEVIDLRPRGKKTDPAAFIEQQRRRAPQVPSENLPLREWGERPEQPPAASGGLGLCERCGTRPAKVRCAQCGEGVCTPDAWSMLGLCKQCVAANSNMP